MPIRTQTLSDGSIIVELDNMDDWDEFKQENAADLLTEYGSFRSAFRHLEQRTLFFGGGAAPRVAVYFTIPEDDEGDGYETRESKARANLSEGW
jgi:hypothetical protein